MLIGKILYTVPVVDTEVITAVALLVINVACGVAIIRMIFSIQRSQT